MVIRGNLVHQKSAELMAWRKAIGLTAKSHFPTPLQGAVEIRLHFGIQRPKTVTRSEPSVKPDLDKYIRAVLDGLTGVAYEDDQQVTFIVARKSYQKTAGVAIELSSSRGSGEQTDGETDTIFGHLADNSYERVIQSK
jgi:Holliday junction resolvase RusA-like endonuclease